MSSVVYFLNRCHHVHQNWYPSMSTHQIHVFISHSWAYSGHYKTLKSWIFEEKWRLGQASINFLDYSVPQDNPIHIIGKDSNLMEAISRKIERSHVVVIPTGMYANYSTWIKKEINASMDKGKPILAVHPWGQQHTSSVVAKASTQMAGWNSKSVIQEIWNLYRF